MTSIRACRIGMMCLGLAWAGFAEAQTKRALIIAIGDYPRPELLGYRPLHSENDVPLVQGALERHGFSASDTRILKSRDAKKDAILEALGRLETESDPGDYVVIHYSGHGHRLTDDSGDEPDGYDEVLVPWGASQNVGPDYDGSGHIRDDVFGRAIAAIGNRVLEGGALGQVLVLVDACFSGSITRSTQPVRGSPDPIGPPGMKTMLDRRRAQLRDGLMDGAGPLPKSVVLLTATRFGELDHEVEAADGTTVGPLSLAFSHAMATVQVGATYQLLFERIRAEMSRIAKYQQPTLEGDSGMTVMGGDLSDPVVYHRVIRSASDSTVVIDGGVLGGVGSGSRIRFSEPSATGFEPVGYGVVSATRHLDSDVRVYGAHPDSIVGSLGVVTERNGVANASIYMAGSDGAFSDGLDRTLSSTEGGSSVTRTRLEGEGSYLLERTRQGQVALHYSVRTLNSPPIRFFADNATGGAQAAQFVKALALGHFLGSVELSAPELDVGLTLQPAQLRVIERWPEPPICRPSEADTSLHTARKDGTNGWVVDADQGYVLTVSNKSEEALYFNLLLLEAGGGIEPLYPEQTVSDNYLPPMTDFLIPQCYVATGQAGASVVKLFATRSPLNLADVLAGIEAGSRTERSGAGAFEAALRDAAGARTRSKDDQPSTGVTRSVLLVGSGS